MFREMRRKKQQLSDDECAFILTNEKRAVMSCIGDDGYPYGVPIDFYYDEAERIIYFHGAKSGHKLESIQKDPKVCFTVYDQGEKSEDWSYFVKSVIVFGKCEIVNDENRRLEKSKLLGLKYYPDEASVDHEIEIDLGRMTLFAIHIEHMTGKRVHEK